MTPLEHAPQVSLPPKPDGPRTPPHLAQLLSDTSPEADAVLVGMLRRLTPTERARRCFSLTAMAVRLSRQAIRKSRPHLSPREVDLCWAELHYGKELADGIRRHLSGGGNDGPRVI